VSKKRNNAELEDEQNRQNFFTHTNETNVYLACAHHPHLLPAMLKRSEALPKVKEWCVANSSFFLFAFFLFCAFLLLLDPLLSGQPSSVHVHPVPLTPSCSFQTRIEANFEDKKGGCVAKRDIFDAYVAFCRAHNYQTTNDATFGKIFKTIFPHVQVRRLVRRVKAKKWHYCDVAYRQDSPLAIGAGPALSATAVATTDDDDCCSDDSGVTAQRRTKAAARCSGRGRGQPKKRKRSTSAAQKKGHLSDDEEVEQEETDAGEKNKKRLRGEEEDEHDDDNDDEDGDYVEQEQPSLMVQAPEEDEVDGGTPSAGATSIWSDSEDESSSSSSSSCYASPSLPDTTSKSAAAEIKHEEDKDMLPSSTDTPVSHTPSERAPVPTCLATSTTGLSLCGGGDIDLSASSVIRVSSMLHSSSAFPLLVGTSAGLPPFGPATKRLDDSSELGSEAPPSLTSSSAEMFFSYQPASSTALADFVKAEPREEAEAEPEEKPARRHPPTPMMAASTVDREQIAPHAVAAAPPAIAPAYAHAHHAHTFPAHYPTHESAAAPAEPSPFEASRNLPIHSQTMTSLLLAHGHTTTSTFSMPTPASYAYAPAPQLIHASSTASANQASAFLPGQQQHYQHGHQHQHQHHQHQHQHQHHSHQHQHHSHQHQQHQQFAYPPYPTAQHQPPPFVTTASATTHPSWPQQTTNHQTTGHQTDREMSPESVEIFISHLLTDKSGEVMTLRPQQ
jgi:hypothetical protein